jgi:hypothetical protein
MNKKPLTIVQRARRPIIETVGLGIRASVIDWGNAAEVEAFADEVSKASSRLNGAAQRMRRIAKQLNKSGAAGAVHETRK